MTICFARNADNELQYLAAIRLTKRTAHAFAPFPKAMSSASIAAQRSKRNDRKEKPMKPFERNKLSSAALRRGILVSSLAREGRGKCCQCENVANTNSNCQ